jgi:hypothetical protein
MEPRWVDVDKLVHELGSLRAVVQEIEAEPDLAQADITRELRACLDRAADVVHLVIGGDQGMMAQARRSMAAAQEVGARARAAVEKARALHDYSRKLQKESAARAQETRHRVSGLKELGNAATRQLQGAGGPAKAK